MRRSTCIQFLNLKRAPAVIMNTKQNEMILNQKKTANEQKNIGYTEPELADFYDCQAAVTTMIRGFRIAICTQQ